jgi:hypothetical protein
MLREEQVCWTVTLVGCSMHQIDRPTLERLNSYVGSRRGYLVSKQDRTASPMSPTRACVVSIKGPRTLFDHRVTLEGTLLEATEVEETKVRVAVFPPEFRYGSPHICCVLRENAPTPDPTKGVYDPYVDIAPSNSCTLF